VSAAATLQEHWLALWPEALASWSPYTMLREPTFYESDQEAAAQQMSGQIAAIRLLDQTVMVNLDGRLAMVVLPAARRVNFGRLCRETGAQDAELATEEEFRDLFPDCEVGAMPPFGNLYGLEVYVDESLVSDADIAFNAGTHTEIVRMPYSEFERVVAPHHVHLMH